MHKIMEMEAKMEAMKSSCETMMGWVKAEMCKNPDCIDIGQLGEAVDIIKDFKEAERDCWQGCFYKLMCEELERESEESERMGYKYPGVRLPRFPYMPADNMMAEYDVMNRELHGKPMGMWPDPRYENGRMGYNRDRTDGTGKNWEWDVTGGDYMGYDRSNNQPRDSYGQYRSARRNYTMTHSEDDKKEMNRYAENHLHEVEETLGDIWASADPEMKKKMKAELSKLVDGMKI